MFAKTIIDSDAFLDMPISARLLYYDLSMRADDDGFVNSPKKIMKFVGATNDDMNILIARKFIIPFDSGVVVIKHWRIHNYIRKDTYNETPYKEEKAMLSIDENKAYTLSNSESRRAVDEPSTQVRLGKVNNNLCSKNASNESDFEIDTVHIPLIENENKQVCEEIEKEDKRAILEQQEKDFAIIYGIYPKKVGKAKAFKRYQKWISKSGYRINGRTYHLTNRDIYLAVENYVNIQKSKGADLQYYKGFDVLLGDSLLDYLEEE